MAKAKVSVRAYAARATNSIKEIKTERSHEENQERAYIAASRRTDRSLEARLQSARMASKIHKKRTGKGLRISEQIILKEEMYEEEDDDLPRSYRLLGAHMHTSSAAINDKLENFTSQKAATTSLLAKTYEDWRANEINKLFELHFGKVTSVVPHQQPQPGHENESPNLPAQQHNILQMQQSQARRQPLPPVPLSITGQSTAVTFISNPQQETSMNSSPTTFPTTPAMPPDMPPDSQMLAQPVVGSHIQRHSRGHSVSIMPPGLPCSALMPKRCTSEIPFSQFTNDVPAESTIDLAPSQHSAFTHEGLSDLYLMTQQPSDDMVPVDVLTMPVDDPWQSFIDDSTWVVDQCDIQQEGDGRTVFDNLLDDFQCV